jgi:two-component system, cell cycle sensor histidine kinase and response regulator CckA
MNSHAESKTILVIEDDHGVRAILTIFLEKSGFTVLEAANAEEARSTWHSQFGMIDAVVADILLPDGNALDVVAQFREERPDLQVVTMSGGVHASARRVRLRRDDVFLPKPFAPATLVHAITAAPRADEVWAKN